MARTFFKRRVQYRLISRGGRSLTVLCCVALLSLAVLSASAVASSPPPPETSTPSASSPQAPEATAPSASGHWAPAPSGVTPMAQSGPITAGNCTYEQAVDDPHQSGGDVSVHGWWLKDSGTCPSTAKVTVWLQAYYCDPLYGCSWVTVGGPSDGDYPPGGGSGKRATARRACSASDPVGWRGQVDVDLDGVSDPSGYTYSTKNLPCSPA